MSLVTSTPSDTAPAPAASPRQPSSAHSDALRYGWILPRRRGAYLTGTAGPNRLGGLDAARGLALLGMMAAHVGFTTCGLTSLSGVLDQAHGRSAVLFAVIAGFSLGIMSGRARPHTGEALIRTRLRILVRSALLLAMGTGLALLGPPVGVILGYYAAWFALALPVLSWRPRNLFILAAVIAVVGPVIKLGTPVALSHLGMTAYPTSGDGNAAVVSFLITGFYPGALWMAYIFLGLGLSRLDWSRSRNLWRLAAVGALCAVIGYGAGWSVSRVVNPDKPDAYHLVSPADTEQCVNGQSRSAQQIGANRARGGQADGPAAPDTAQPPSDSGSANMTDATGATDATDATDTDATAADTTDSSTGITTGSGGANGMNSMNGMGGQPVNPAPFNAKALATAGPHTDTTFEAVGSGGTAMLVIALLQLVSRRLRWVVAPLAAVGSMSLTVYCGHVAAIWALNALTFTTDAEDNLLWAVMSTGFIAFAMAWFAVWARGPLEHLVHVVSMRATRG